MLTSYINENNTKYQIDFPRLIGIQSKQLVQIKIQNVLTRCNFSEKKG